MKWEEAIKLFKIHESFHDASLDKAIYLEPDIIDKGKRWLALDKKPSLYIYGIPGCGKSYFTHCLFKGLIDAGHNWVQFVRSEALDEEFLHATYNRCEKNVMDKYCEVPYLFIDDLGTERADAERVIKQYYGLIDTRTGNRLPTIFTSNVEIKDLKLGERIPSRLALSIPIPFPPVDLRPIIQAKMRESLGF